MEKVAQLVTPFKLDHYRLLLHRLLSRGDVEFITYDDLRWQPNDDHTNGYPLEWDRWRSDIKSGVVNGNTVFVLIQHDIDSGPNETLDMLHMEYEYGIRSNTMLFNKWRGASECGQIVDYPANFDIFSELQKFGFVFGYHCNAFHNNNFVADENIYKYFINDIIDLRKKFDIRYFSPHGGKTINGFGNATFDYLTETNFDVYHVHNGFSPSFNGSYSDGGLIKRLRNDGQDNLDFYTWTDRLKPGGRYRILIHPQYFSDINFKPLTGVNSQWYDRLVNG